MPSTPPLILASTSPYRRTLLQRLQLPFEVCSPGVDEAPLPNERPAERAVRLAAAKALAVARERPEAVVIGSDQVASLLIEGREQVLDKPGEAARAAAQLSQLSGRAARFDTAVCVRLGEVALQHTDTTWVHFRRLSDTDIQRYLAREPALDCAGSFKSEGLGSALFERIETTDPTGLVGLPLIWLADALRQTGLMLP